MIGHPEMFGTHFDLCLCVREADRLWGCDAPLLMIGHPEMFGTHFDLCLCVREADRLQGRLLPRKRV